MDIKIFCFAHKEVPYGLPENTITVGAANRNLVSNSIGDNTGDNISEWNNLYSEASGTYWIWKNVKSDIKGQFQYRRRFNLSDDKIEEIINSGKIIVGSFFETNEVENDNVYKHYNRCHNIEDLDIAINLILKLYPHYCDSIEKYILNGTEFFYSAGYIMKSEYYDNWCDFFFTIMKEFCKIRNFNTPQDVNDFVDNSDKYPENPAGYYYQKQIGGFLAERLFTLWAKHNFEGNIVSIPYTKMEDNIL